MNLSIIIPVYNAAPYLERCINSIRPGAELDYEIICINDGSTDDSYEILKRLQEEDSHIKIHSQTNKGLSIAVNTGISLCTSEYFIIIGADDWVDFAIIEELYWYARKNDLDLISFGMFFFYNDTGKQETRELYPLKYNTVMSGQEALCQGYQPSSMNLFVYRTQLIRENNLAFTPGLTQQDIEFTVRLMLVADKVFFSEKPAYTYFKHSGTLSMPSSEAGLRKYLSDTIIVATLIRDNINSGDYDSKVVRSIQKNYNSIIWNLLWRFWRNPKEINITFKKECISIMKQNGLYPIKGPLKTPLQKITRYLFNIIAVR